MKSIQQQRKDVRRLWYRTHLMLDELYADLPDEWERIVLQHADRAPDGTLRITPMARARILAACEQSLIALEMPVTFALSGAVKRAAALPREAIEP